MKSEMIWHTPEPEKLIAAAMRRCYHTAVWEELYPLITDEYASYLVRAAFFRYEFDVYEHVRALFLVEAGDDEMLNLIREHPYVRFSTIADRRFVVGLNLRTLVEMARRCRGGECQAFKTLIMLISPTAWKCISHPPSEEPSFNGEKPVKRDYNSYSEMRVLLVRSINSNEVRSMCREAIPSNELLKHAYFTFEIEGVSRAFSHQFVRHRLCSFSQESQRFSDAPKEAFVMPASITTISEAVEKVRSYVEEGKNLYTWLRSLKVPKEDARFLLHTGLATKILATIPADELLHMTFYRSDFGSIGRKAQWEIRRVLNECYRIAREVEPLLPERVKEP